MRTAAQLFVECLENEGVHHIFGIPGEETLDLIDALDAARRSASCPCATSRAPPSWPTSTAGSRAGRRLPGDARAGRDEPDHRRRRRLPRPRADGGASPARSASTGPQGEPPVRRRGAACCGRSRSGTRASSGRETSRRWSARRSSWRSRRSRAPTHLELSETIAAAELPSTRRPLPERRTAAPAAPRPASRRRAAELIRGAPAAGDPGRQRRHPPEASRAALRRFAAARRHPGLPDLHGQGRARPATALPRSRRWACRRATRSPPAWTRRTWWSASATTWWSSAPPAWNPEPDKRIIHIDTSRRRGRRALHPRVELVGRHIGDSLDARPRASSRPGPSRPFTTACGVGTTEPHAGERPGVVSPQARSARSARAMAPDDVLVSDVGAHKLWLGAAIPGVRAEHGDRLNGFATMGIGLPGAIAARLALPRRPRVVRSRGDGGFLMNVPGDGDRHAPRPARQRGVWSDGAYGVIGWKQERRFGRTHAIEFGNPGLVRPGRVPSAGRHRYATGGAAWRRPRSSVHWPRTSRPSSGPDRLPPECQVLR